MGVWTVVYVELVQLTSHASSLLATSEAGEQGLRGGVDNTELVGVERGRKLGRIQLRDPAERLVKDVFATTAKGNFSTPICALNFWTR